jgi:hypothetical protein
MRNGLNQEVGGSNPSGRASYFRAYRFPSMLAT